MPAELPRSGLVQLRLWRALHKRKNALFAGSDEGGANWAAIASLIETCKLNGVDPQAYFTDLLTRLVNSWPQARIDELMPWNYRRQTIH